MCQLRQRSLARYLLERLVVFLSLSFWNRVFQCGPSWSRTDPSLYSTVAACLTFFVFFLISSLLKYVSPTSTCLLHRLACSVLGVTCTADLEGHHNVQMKAGWAWATGSFMAANGFEAFEEVPAQESHRILAWHKSCLRMAVRHTCKC